MRNYVFSKLSGQVVEMMSLVEEITFASMDRRLAGFLLGTASSADGEAKVEMTHDQIACELGLCRGHLLALIKQIAG